jgi:UDP-GlcNAc:undecaprenyl-phosphate/decaprenyl-phosphate GlcNAc-1-phosphate transferase
VNTPKRLPVAVNHRGKPVGVWLGIALVGSVAAPLALGAAGLAIGSGHLTLGGRRLLWMTAGLVCVFAAGLYDDYRPARRRGLIAQVRPLLKGRLTPGGVKLGVIVIASGLTCWELGARGWRLALGVPAVAGATNLWNLFDVAPGRAIKFVLPALVGLTLAVDTDPYRALGGATFVAAVAALTPDLREWAMLGDAGANALGYVVGVGMIESVPTVGLAVAVAVLLAAHAAAETVTLSRIIRSIPPLRWFDDLGRVRPVDPGGQTPQAEVSSSS